MRHIENGMARTLDPEDANLKSTRPEFVSMESGCRYDSCMRAIFVVFFTAVVSEVPAAAMSQQRPNNDVFRNDVYRFMDLDLGRQSIGRNDGSAYVVNMSDQPRYCAIDVRTESCGLGRSNWQSQTYFEIPPGATNRISFAYELFAPIFGRIIVRFGETDVPFDRETWLALPAAERTPKEPPKIKFLWRGVFTESPDVENRVDIAKLVDARAVCLTPVERETLQKTKADRQEILRTTRSETAEERLRLRRLFRLNREVPADFDVRREEWRRGYEYLDDVVRPHGVSCEIFSIQGDENNRITAVLVTQESSAANSKPAILLLSGNPPGTKESLVGAAIFFARLGYHAVAIDRRDECRTLDSREKFLTNLADPVYDATRVLDYLERQVKYRISGFGVYGFSAGAREAEFVAALDHRIRAAVLACGIASHNSFFVDASWIPTFSGMILYPELGLGSPDIGNMSSEEFWHYYEKAGPEHHTRARELFREHFPYFDELDAQSVAPLIVPTPLLVVSGAQDEQFTVAGVIEVDRAVQSAYRKHNLGFCSDLHIESRAGHTMTWEAGLVVGAFFNRWLK